LESTLAIGFGVFLFFFFLLLECWGWAVLALWLLVLWPAVLGLAAPALLALGAAGLALPEV
jgi:hypothetical protein